MPRSVDAGLALVNIWFIFFLTMNQNRPRRLTRSRVPAGRLERLARFGWMAGDLAARGVAEGVRRLGRSEAPPSSVLLTAAAGERLARRLATLRGAAMKVGQLLSLEGDDFLPPEFARALAILRASGDAMPDGQLHGVLREEYGPTWRARFRHFDPDPIATASIGQVHAAVALDGQELALKIQYPGVARSIESDVDNLATALRLARLLPGGIDIRGVLEEAKRQLRQEADYEAEAAFLGRYADLLCDAPEFVVPRVRADLSTPRVLAMERLRGRPLEDLLGPEHGAGTRSGAAALLYRLLFRELFEFRFMQTDPNLGNYLLLDDARRLGLLDLGSAREIPAELAGRYAQLFAAGLGGDRAGLRRVAREIGFFAGDEREDRVDGVVDLLWLGCEPFRHRGPYDFGSTDLASRLRESGLDLALRRGFLRPPPPETLFLHRKLSGTFLLAARLGARFDVRSLVEPFLARCREPLSVSRHAGAVVSADRPRGLDADRDPRRPPARQPAAERRVVAPFPDLDRGRTPSRLSRGGER
jgi:predicted unusual protein kinase regulating ubiquinone biosynthesis (AarF/ABC1/UbiB family)